MKDESDPVAPDEHVFRRILNRTDHYDPSPSALRRVSPAAWRPRDDEADGISVYREECGVTAEQVSGDGNNPSGYCVARVMVQNIIDAANKVGFGPLTFSPTRGAGSLKGHVSIREINSTARKDKARKEKLRELIDELVLLSASRVVYVPPPR